MSKKLAKTPLRTLKIFTKFLETIQSDLKLNNKRIVQLDLK